MIDLNISLAAPLAELCGWQGNTLEKPGLREWGACCSRHFLLLIGMQRRPCARTIEGRSAGRTAGMCPHCSFEVDGARIPPHALIAIWTAPRRRCKLPSSGASRPHGGFHPAFVGWLDVSDEAQSWREVPGAGKSLVASTGVETVETSGLNALQPHGESRTWPPPTKDRGRELGQG